MVLNNLTAAEPHHINSNPLTPFKDRFACTLETCSVSISLYGYQPNIAVNLLFTILFAVAGLIHLTQLIFWPKTFFSCAIAIGCAVEVVGYISRIVGHENPYGLALYFVQFIGLTAAPAFFSASIYSTLGEITRSLGPRFSRLRPETYTKAFVLSDIASLILQASGGLTTLGLLLGGQDTKSHYGINIMLVGLGYQILSLMAFIYLAAEFAWRLGKYNKAQGKSCFVPGKGEGRLQVFVVMFCLSVLCMFVRCCYRCAELSGGLMGHLLRDEITFIFLEGMLISVCVFALNLGHPGMLPKRESASLDLDEEIKYPEKQMPRIEIFPAQYHNKYLRSNVEGNFEYRKPPIPPKPTSRVSGLQTFLSPPPASHFRRHRASRQQYKDGGSDTWPLVQGENRTSSPTLTDIYAMYDVKDGGTSDNHAFRNSRIGRAFTKQCNCKKEVFI